MASDSVAEYVPTHKYASVEEMFSDKNNYPPDDGSFKLIKNNPPEFIIYPSISQTEDQENILDQYKYAALEGLLLTFAQTDASQLTVHIQPRIINDEKPISDAAKQALRLKITLKATREDVANALHKIQIYDFDTLIDHGDQLYAIAGRSNSEKYSRLRSDDETSWKLINSFRTDKYK